MFQCKHPSTAEEVTLLDCARCLYRPRLIEADARRLLLVNKLSPGDVLVMTAAIECLHRQHPGSFVTAIDTSANEIFEHNPHVEPAGPDFETIQMEYPLIHQSGDRPVHFLQGYVDWLAEKLKIPLKLTTNRPHVYLSNEEKSWLGRVEEITGKKQRYWLVNAGTKADYTAKGWGHHHYQEVVNQLRDDVFFVQIGSKEHLHKPLEGVFNQLGKTTIRELIRLVYHADGVLSGTTFLMHLAAAFEKPAVILAGAREPQSWNTYPRQTLFSTVGALACGMSPCWKSRTVPLGDSDQKDKCLCARPVLTEPEPVPECLNMIHPDEVVAAIRRYLHGQKT